ncbi:CAAX prenyl protease 2-like isoform X2 [Tubulanus polymorphus]|uniref:CAAX prenyl protease 2-like isoform X2 n=1 Tax=Tubulanus polymorphus TaxID=672921 RepID=UPI003DA5E880
MELIIHPKDHPAIVKRRFLSVLIVCALGPCLLWLVSSYSYCSNERAHRLFEWLGVRFDGSFNAVFLPLLLTMILFLGPLAMQYEEGIIHLYFESEHWLECFKDIYWWRSHVMAPFTEEFVFRACMLPLLVSSLGCGKAVIFCPLLFGVAHLHHVIEMVNQGKPVLNAFIICLCQFGYTTLFGIYSGFLFIRTGHVAAPVVVHMFCNHMGFPDFSGIFSYSSLKTRLFLITSYIIGIICWMFLLYPVTKPHWYYNTVYSLD